MISETTDKPGHSLRALLHVALKSLPDDGLYTLLRDKDSVVCSMAAARLHTIERLSERTFSESVRLSESKESRLRELSAFILGQLCPPRYPYRQKSFPILSKLLIDENDFVRAAAVAALGHLGAQDYRNQIVGALADPSRNVFKCAVYSLWSLGLSDSDKEALSAIAQKADPNTRRWIGEFLESPGECSEKGVAYRHDAASE